MSKMDDMRAMREARYARRAAGGDLPTHPARRTPVPGGAAAAPASAAVAERPDAEPQAGLCGHKAISGRTCTREKGHDAKSHRYS